MWMRALCLFGVFSGTSVEACETALLLAVDVSGSIDAKEYRIQMDGLAAALRDNLVVQALVDGKNSVAVMQWTGENRQELSVPWRQVSSSYDVEALALAVEQMPRAWNQYSTAIGDALIFAQSVLKKGPACRRKVVDVSGDGVSNEGVVPEQGREILRLEGVTVNALVIETDDLDLTGYFWENVITGDAAFVATAQGFEEYPLRIRQKLIRELARQTVLLE